MAVRTKLYTITFALDAEEGDNSVADYIAATAAQYLSESGVETDVELHLQRGPVSHYRSLPSVGGIAGGAR